MHKKLEPIRKWFGEWTGRGETMTGVPVMTRMVIQPRMAEQFIEFMVESLHAESQELVHGVVTMLTVDPDGETRMAVTSTMHGTIVMPVTPEDPGALAIEGMSVTGNHVVVSLIEEDDGLMLTSYWKPNEPEAEKLGYTNIKLKRVSPAGA
jgi:hypothetical protein